MEQLILVLDAMIIGILIAVFRVTRTRFRLPTTIKKISSPKLF